MLNLKTHYLKKIYSWLLPFSCILCLQPQKYKNLCDFCENDLLILKNGCQICAKPLKQENHICGECLILPPFQKIYAAFQYEFPMVQLIRQLKFKQHLINAKILASLMIPHIKQWYCDRKIPDVVIPIPLHVKRLRKRGFNQVLEVLKPIAKHFNLKIDTTSQRIVDTLPQSNLPIKARKENIKNAFSLNKLLNYDYVAVMDDVITTGETMKEFCQALKNHGIKKIDVWCIARPCLVEHIRES